MSANDNVFEDFKSLFLIFIYILSYILIYLNVSMPCIGCLSDCLWYENSTVLILYNQALIGCIIVILIFILCFMIIEKDNNTISYIYTILFILFLIPILMFLNLAKREYSVTAQYIFILYFLCFILLFLFRKKNIFLTGAFKAILLLLPHFFLILISFETLLLCD